MPYISYARTDTGLFRDSNEDAYFKDDQLGLYIVSDGMGGLPGGEVASEITVNELPKLLKPYLDDHPSLDDVTFQAHLQECVQTVNSFIYREGITRELNGMGATLVLALVNDEQALVAHVGDSRAYYFAGGRLKQLTEDHSHSVHENVLTRSMGSETVVQADIAVHRMSKGARLLLCSDGLNHMIPDDEISEAFTEDSGQKICYNLINRANEAGGHDNITVILIEES